MAENNNTEYIFKIQSKSPKDKSKKSESIIGMKVEHFQKDMAQRNNDANRPNQINFKLPVNALDSQTELIAEAKQVVMMSNQNFGPVLKQTRASVGGQSNFLHAGR